MQIQIITTEAALQDLLNVAIGRALTSGHFTNPPTPTENDRCDLSDAKTITGLSESKLYKLTAADEIPVRRYGKKLIFSRKELNQWVESKTVSDTMQSNAVLELAKSANKKGVRRA